MKTMLKKLVFPVVTLLTMAVLFAGCASKPAAGPANTDNKAESTYTPTKLRIGVVPSEENEEIAKRYKPVVDYLAKELGMDVEFFAANDYTGVVEAMRSKHLDLAHFGPFSYILAADKANAECLVAGVYNDGNKYYKSLIITRQDSGIKTIKDLKGKNFSFVDPASTSGNLVPRKTLLDGGIDPEKDIKGIYAGGHDASGLAVQNKKVDAGAISTTTFKLMQAKGLVPDVAVIAESMPIPASPLAARKDLDPTLKEKILQAYIHMHEKSPEAIKALKTTKMYAAADDKEYDGLRDLAKILKLDLNKVQ